MATTTRRGVILAVDGCFHLPSGAILFLPKSPLFVGRELSDTYKIILHRGTIAVDCSIDAIATANLTGRKTGACSEVKLLSRPPATETAEAASDASVQTP